MLTWEPFHNIVLDTGSGMFLMTENLTSLNVTEEDLLVCGAPLTTREWEEIQEYRWE